MSTAVCVQFYLPRTSGDVVGLTPPPPACYNNVFVGADCYGRDDAGGLACWRLPWPFRRATLQAVVVNPRFGLPVCYRLPSRESLAARACCMGFNSCFCRLCSCCFPRYSQAVGAVTSVDMTMDGMYLLASSRHGPVRTWDVRMGRPLLRYKVRQRHSGSGDVAVGGSFSCIERCWLMLFILYFVFCVVLLVVNLYTSRL